MKKLIIFACVLLFLPVLVKADEGSAATGTPAYTERFVEHSCRAFDRAVQNQKNIRNLEHILAQKDAQIAVLQKQQTKRFATSTQTLINKRTEERTALAGFIAALKGTSTPVFCYGYMLKENTAEIAKTETKLNGLEMKAQKIMAQIARNASTTAQKIGRLENSATVIEREMASTTDPKKLMAKQKRIGQLNAKIAKEEQGLTKKNNKLNEQLTKINGQIAALEAKITQLETENDTYQSGN